MLPLESKIMIVDDSSFARTLLKNSLRDLGYAKVLIAIDGEAGQGLLQEEEQLHDPVRLIILDVFMPGMSGVEFLRWLRSRPEFANLPVIMATTKPEKQQILEAAKLGISHFFTKPVTLAALKEGLDRIVLPPLPSQSR